ncbi:MAG: helix-turn-helix transcriptional regulator [Bacteroidia bacterium]|nr:helix-turn-helix transcriptional regulator [Bacteroidia bacterium]
MLPGLEKVEANINHSFHINHMKVDYFPSLRHFHPEVEILLVVQGRGTRYVGDSVEPFSPCDLVMIGPNVSHEWLSDKKSGSGISEAIYILFNPDILGSEFWNLPESKIILKIIRQSERGMKLTGRTRDDVASLMKRIDTSYGFTRITLLMTILEMIAFNGEFQYLASPVVQNTINERDTERLNKVYKYVLDNFQQQISLERASSIANLSKPAFCRYFRKRANKTFMRFLNEVRVGQACRMLVNENKSIADICYACGFNNISYFIRQFRSITGFTPLGYRKKFED